MNKFMILILFLIVIATAEIFFIFIPTDAFAEQVPNWFKHDALWWADGSIDDATFLDATSYLVSENIIVVETESTQMNESKIPDWIKNNARWWSEGNIDNETFVDGIEFLYKIGILGINDKVSTIFPNSIKIQRESTIFGVNISVTNTDNVPHTFTAGTTTDGQSGEFDSRFLAPNDEYTIVIQYAGEIPYFCMIHPWEEGILKISNDNLYLLNQEIERERLEKEQERLEFEKQEAKKQKFNEIAFEFYKFMDYTLVIDQKKYSIPNLEEIRLHFGEEKYQLLDDMTKRPNGMAVSLEEKAFEIEMMEYHLNLFKQDMSERFEKVDEFFEDTKQQINDLDISEDKKLQYINEIQSQKDAKIFEIIGGMKVLVQLEDDIAQMKKELEYEADLLGKSLEFDDSICGEGTIMKNGQCVVDTKSTIVSEPTYTPEPTTKGGGCLIATATYGSELAPQVQQLRELRDSQLLNTVAGTNFMKSFNEFYYSFSPIIADYERENPIFKEAVKIVITPMIASLSILNYVDMNSEGSVLGYGVSLIVLNVMIYVGMPVITVSKIRSYFH